jgi:hypothetical protein
MCDVIKRRLQSAAGEYLGGRGQDPLPVPLGVPAQRPARLVLVRSSHVFLP